MGDPLLAPILSRIEENPGRLAVVDGSGAWSRQELLCAADGYAAAIRESVVACKAIPLFCGRNKESVAAILGCLRAGCAFAPLSPDQPSDRIRSCLTRLEADCYISTLAVDGVGDLGTDGMARVVPIAKADRRIDASDDVPGRGLAYVLFTSGSTGVPKGVMVSRANLANTVAWSQEVLEWREGDVIGLVVNFYFDISVFDVFVSLSQGVPLAVVDAGVSPPAVISQLSAFGVTSIFAAPSFFSQFVRLGLVGDAGLSRIRRIISGGDFFPPRHVLSWVSCRPDVEVINAWGPTETSIVNTMHLVGVDDFADLEAGRPAPVGRSHPKMRVVLVDDALRPVSPGTSGEICMTGDSVSMGYLGDPERTRQCYFEFEGEPAYRTQDLGIMDERGSLRVLGRLGSMTKVNGYRVDLQEVEGAVGELQGVHRAVAFVRSVNLGIEELWIAIECADLCAPAIEVVKEHCRRRLPNYMVPKRIFMVDAIPLTPNGKIDRNELLSVCTSSCK